MRLVLRNIQFQDTKDESSSPTRSWEALESLRYVNREMLVGAQDKYTDEVDVSMRLKEDADKDGTESEHASLFGE